MKKQNDCSGPCCACAGWHHYGKDGNIIKQNNCYLDDYTDDGFLEASQEQLKLRLQFEPKYADELADFID